MFSSFSQDSSGKKIHQVRVCRHSLLLLSKLKINCPRSFNILVLALRRKLFQYELHKNNCVITSMNTKYVYLRSSLQVLGSFTPKFFVHWSCWRDQFNFRSFILFHRTSGTLHLIKIIQENKNLKGYIYFKINSSRCHTSSFEIHLTVGTICSTQSKSFNKSGNSYLAG